MLAQPVSELRHADEALIAGARLGADAVLFVPARYLSSAEAGRVAECAEANGSRVEAVQAR